MFLRNLRNLLFVFLHSSQFLGYFADLLTLFKKKKKKVVEPSVHKLEN